MGVTDGSRNFLISSALTINSSDSARMRTPSNFFADRGLGGEARFEKRDGEVRIPRSRKVPAYGFLARLDTHLTERGLQRVQRTTVYDLDVQ